MENMAEDNKPTQGTVPVEPQRSLATTNTFEELGHKVEGISLNGNSAGENGSEDVKEPRMVEEIKSLCMNCHDEVRPAKAD